MFSLALVAAANHTHRGMDVEDEENIKQLAPENSRIAKLRAAKRLRQAVGDNVSAPLSRIKEQD